METSFSLTPDSQYIPNFCHVYLPIYPETVYSFPFPCYCSGTSLCHPSSGDYTHSFQVSLLVPCLLYTTWILYKCKSDGATTLSKSFHGFPCIYNKVQIPYSAQLLLLHDVFLLFLFLSQTPSFPRIGLWLLNYNKLLSFSRG